MATIGCISGPNGCTVKVQDALKCPWPENAPMDVPARQQAHSADSKSGKSSQFVTEFKVDGVRFEVEGNIDGGTVVRADEPSVAKSQEAAV